MKNLALNITPCALVLGFGLSTFEITGSLVAVALLRSR